MEYERQKVLPKNKVIGRGSKISNWFRVKMSTAPRLSDQSPDKSLVHEGSTLLGFGNFLERDPKRLIILPYHLSFMSELFPSQPFKNWRNAIWIQGNVLILPKTLFCMHFNSASPFSLSNALLLTTFWVAVSKCQKCLSSVPTLNTFGTLEHC